MSSGIARRGRRAVIGALSGALVVVGVVGSGGTAAVAAPAAAAAPVSDATAMRQGVIALAGAISAVGQTPQLASRLPLTTVSPADVLDLEGTLVEGVDAALSGTGDLRSALDRIEGVTVAPGSTAQRIKFSFEAEGERDLTLTHDDGDLRLGGGASAGRLTVSLRTTKPFVVSVDPSQDDPLLRTALTSQPVMELVVDVRKPEVDPFGARKGFTELEVTGGTYAVHREQTITMRDPDGRSLLTLEDLRYSTLPDLFRVETDADADRLDVDLDVELPDSLPSPDSPDAARTGTLTTETDPADPGQAWPAKPVLEDAGAALTQATSLTVVDGISALAQYTGTVLALQDAADVPFPSVSGGTSDVFAPGDRLLEVLTSAAAAQVTCGVSPGSPPSGVAAPGDTVYCQAVTAPGTSPTNVDWTLLDGGDLASTPAGAIGPEPTDSVVVTGGDGEPDLQVTFDLKRQPMAGRTLPRTVQDVVRRLDGLADSEASASLETGQLRVAVDISDDSATARLPIGNPGTVGALVGLTGLDAEPPTAPGAPEPEPVRAEVEATDASFDVGFGISTDTPAPGEPRETVLLPADASLLRIGGLGATPPATVTDLPARVGFLGVEADLTELDLGVASGGPAVELTRVVPGGGSPTAALPLGDLVAEDGTVDADQLSLDSRVTGALGLEATEQPLPDGGFAVSTGTEGASGTVSVRWGPAGLPTVEADAGYTALRVFDPVPAGFVSGTARVTGSGDTTQVHLDVAGLGGTTLYELLNAAAPQNAGDPVEVLRQVTGQGAACPSVVIEDTDTLTCTGLVADGTPIWADGEQVQAVVDGDPYAVRDSVVEGFASALSRLDRQADDGLTGQRALDADQLTTSLPLVDLVPAQLSTEREALRQGVAALDAAATEDEQLQGGGTLPPVSSAQEMSRAVGSLVKTGDGRSWAPALGFELGDQLEVSLGATRPGGTQEAGLRLDDDTRGLVASGTNAAGKQDTLDVTVGSTTVLGVEIDPATARSALGTDTGTTSTATLDLGPAGVENRPLQAGVAALRVQADDAGDPATTSEARLGVQVTTTTNDDGTLETIRTGTRGQQKAAVAVLAVGTDDVITYEADATETSGGAGTAAAAPDPMQVRFLAEGLDGLAAAIGSAQDGAAVRNLDPVERTPISAPLIGTDLDAGAEVPETLTTLTSELRTSLRAIPATVTEGDKLDEALQGAVVTAVNKTDELVDVAVADVTAEVTCNGVACVPCPAPAAGAPATPCLTDTSTGWDQVRVDVTLTGERVEGSVPFQTGLAGLEVRSDKPIATVVPEWTLPISLQLTRGVGPQVVVEAGDTLSTTVEAEMPSAGIEAIVGYLPATIKPTSAAAGSLNTTIEIAPAEGTYDLFQLYDGELTATPSFADTPGQDPEEGLELTFETLDLDGLLGLDGALGLPWTPGADGGGEFDTVTYGEVRLDVGKVLSTIATPFAVVDPYLAPVRDVVDVLRSPIPVISDLSELAGGGEVSLLTLLETASKATKKPQLELAHRVIGLIGGATDVISGVAGLAQPEGKVPLEAVAGAASLIEVEPEDVALYEKCTQVTRTTTSRPTGSTTTVGKPQPCEDEDEAAGGGAAGQTAQETQQGKRNNKKSVNISQTTKSVTGQLPGFSLPFLTDTDQIMNLLTGEGEASYFRLDLGTLTASVSYSRKFGPIMAGPVPIVPFVGGSISLEGRLAMGFDSYPQTLAAQGVNPGDVKALKTAYGDFDGGVITEGFYLDDLDADGEDVPEVQLVTTIEAGASVSIGIVSAGLKGGVTLTIGLDLNDPDDSGRLRTAEIRDRLNGDASCIFDASGDIEAFIAVFVEIELLFTSLEYEFDILRLGPYALFRYGCEDVTPALVTANGDGSVLTLTSGEAAGSRYAGASDVADEYEVRQFKRGGTTRYEVSAFGRVQNVDVTPSGGSWQVQVYDSATGASATPKGLPLSSPTRPVFRADGGELDDTLSFLTGEDFAENAQGELELETTPFDTDVALLTGGPGKDVLVTGAGDDSGVDGEGEADSIDVGAGDDSATGGAGDDSVVGGSGSDDVLGGEGADDVSGGAGPDRVRGEGGADRLAGGPGIDVRKLLVQTRAGGEADVLRQAREGFDSGDVVIGGADADLVDGGDGSDTVVGGEPTAALTGPMADLFVDGTRTVDVLVQGDAVGQAPTFVTRDLTLPTARVPGEAQLDALCTSGTELTGAAQTDVVTGGPEADVVVGSNGADVLDGGAGPDEVCGRAGDDAISGDGPGAELLGEDQTAPVEPVDGAENADVVRGGSGDDQVDAGLGDDVVFGDDVDLAAASGPRVLDGSLRGSGSTAAEGAGDDFLDGAEGDDVLAGGDGSDLLVGSEGDDLAYGEGRDTPASGGTAPSVSERLLACNPTTRAVRGLVDLNGDLAVADTTTTEALDPDTGQLAGLRVVEGRVRALGSSDFFTGLVAGEVVVKDGYLDLDRDGVVGGDADDTGPVPLASMIDDAGNADGDCVLAGDGDDDVRGGNGSDHLALGDGVDLADGGDGNDLVLGDGGTDVLLGGPHHDVLVGGLGADHLAGGDGDDRLRGNEGADDLVGGGETPGATDGQDVLLGGPSSDVLVAENGVAVSTEVVGAVAGATPSWAGDPVLPQAVEAGTGSTWRFAGSAMLCGVAAGAEPTRWVTLAREDGAPGTPVASPGTPLAYDELYGGADCDLVLGSQGDDVVRGGPDDDLVEGGPGADLGWGDDGDDVVVGGSSYDRTARLVPFTTTRTGGAGQPDGADALRGDGGPDAVDGDDLVSGDNALPTYVPARGDYELTLHDVASATSTPAAGTSAGDTISGDGGDDLLFGQGGGDVVGGGTGEDYLEGGSGADRMAGSDGDDDLVGGSSSQGRPQGTDGLRLTQTLAAGPVDSSAAGLLDGADEIDGGSGADWALGDNGRITRPTGQRHLARAAEATASGAGVFGDDDLTGGSGEDRLLGQLGEDDLAGDAGADHLEGNEGDDDLVGGSAADVVIGGSSLSPDGRGTLAGLLDLGRTQPDGDDVIDGDDASASSASPDLLLGDNATVLVVAGRPVVQLHDLATTLGDPAAGTSGDDEIVGGPATGSAEGTGDRVFGQGGDDEVVTGPGEDHLEGGAGGDTLTAGGGDDDVLGGGSAVDGRPLGADGTRLVGSGQLVFSLGVRLLDGTDRIEGAEGDDVLLGDNGVLTRPADAPDERADGTTLRTVRLLDPVTGEGQVPVTVGAGDTILAGEGRDLAFGQAGDDELQGQDGEDYLEGNVGADLLDGGADEDDLVGGGSVADGVVVSSSGGGTVTDRISTPLAGMLDRSAAGLLDGGDTLRGGDARDVVLGDNGRITREGIGRVLDGGASGPHRVRQVAMADEVPGPWAGSDAISGGAGDDDLYGQLDSTLSRRPQQLWQGTRVPGDVLEGGAGDDALVGDQGRSVPTPVALLGAPDRVVRADGGFFAERVRPRGTLVRVVTLTQSGVGGDDLLLAGDGLDAVHAGAGKDVVDAGAGDDAVFGGDGSDALWGGVGHDRVFGGAGADSLDTKRRRTDPALWQLAAPRVDTDGLRRTLNGRDLLYGGSGTDALQADQGDRGGQRRVQGDRLVDWTARTSYFKVCSSGYGPGRVRDRVTSPMVAALRELARASGSVGSAELAIPVNERLTSYPGPRSLVCESR
ncbi:calcium-binding protein [Nocardioides nanhaiensis]|uniref:Calcium-binding protein n=1 Tax=Nocardioides nanhaiensis TaxID=1476871 RepID=A0ABP8VPD4_9ACTN